MNLTSEQLTELTERINAMLAEFDVALMPQLSRGVVRLMVAVVMIWLQGPDAEALWVPDLSRSLPRAAQAVGGAARESQTTGVRRVPPDARLPDPDEARERLATALATGQADGLHVRLRTLADVDADGAEDADEDKSEDRPRYFLPSRKQVIEEVGRQAMGGTMPTQVAYDAARPMTWPTAPQTCARLQVSWVQLAHEAKLVPNKRGRHVAA